MAPNKKNTRQASAKLATGKNAYSIAGTPQESAEKVLRFGKEILSTGADEAYKAQEKLFSISRDGAEKMAKSADSATKFMSESVAASRDNIESCIECSNVGAAMAKDFSSEIFEAANQAFSDSIEVSKEIMACRTLNDMIELNNRLFNQACDRFLNTSTKFSDMLFEYANEAIEPINERVSQASEQFSKAFANK